MFWHVQVAAARIPRTRDAVLNATTPVPFDTPLRSEARRIRSTRLETNT
jgi:hypothetical protein